jgi:hypothetical protein
MYIVPSVSECVRDFIHKVNFAILYFHVTAWSVWSAIHNRFVRTSPLNCILPCWKVTILQTNSHPTLSLCSLRPMVQKGQRQSIIVKCDVTGV